VNGAAPVEPIDADPAAPPGAAVAAPVGRLERSQEARRRRLMIAATALVAEGGYDAVQMRDVAARADVALGTIYRYYSSKDHLLAEINLRWMRDLAAEVATRAWGDATPLERLVEVVRMSTEPVERDSRMGEVFIRTATSGDAAAAACHRELGALQLQMLEQALADVDPETRDGVIRVLRLVWYAALVGKVSGWANVDGVREELERTARLLLA
jgi:TetR/AcrR family transcriptional regulator, cholesterol catabolism regulator